MRNYASPMFQHRHYAAIASALAAAKPSQDDITSGQSLETWETTVGHMMQLFRGDNTNFQANRFVAAANGDPINNKDRRG